ncbi:MAG: hypothetical protein Q9220_002018 [cf. Caloplaca sp. 1 TL-2023]
MSSQQKPIATNGRNFTSKTHHEVYPTIEIAKLSSHGLRVFITGASKGIGLASAIAYAQSGAAAIGIGARSDLAHVEKAIKKAAADAGKQTPKIVKCSLDIQDRGSVEAAAKVVGEEMGTVDVLVNNAGYLESWLPLAESDPDDWWRTWEVNVRGIYLTTRSFLPLLLAGDRKTILNITSAGAHNATRGASAYQTSKLAILRLTEFTNVEYGEQGVVAFSIHPGGVMTNLAKGMPQAMQDHTPELAANTFVYLTQERQEWLRGRYVNVTWDMEEFFGKKEEIVEKDLLRVRLAVE